MPALHGEKVDKYYTIMIVPEKEKGIRSIKIPGIFVRSIAFVLVLVSILFGILMYNYWTIIQQIHENKHLSLENRMLREQIQSFQTKINSLAGDFNRINEIENKLRIITGLEDVTKTAPIVPPNKNDVMMDDHSSDTVPIEPDDQSVKLDKSLIEELKDYKQERNYVEIKSDYDKKIARNFRLNPKYKITRKFSDLIKKGFELSSEYASFDYKYRKIKNYASKLEQIRCSCPRQRINT